MTRAELVAWTWGRYGRPDAPGTEWRVFGIEPGDRPALRRLINRAIYQLGPLAFDHWLNRGQLERPLTDG